MADSKGCRDCKYCRVVYANGGWSFLGCYCEPYHGKWCKEIKTENCPKQKLEV